MYELRINVEDVSKYLGFVNKEVDEETLSDIERLTKVLQEHALPKVEYRVFKIEKNIPLEDGTTGIKVMGTNLMFRGKAIRDLLLDCEECILLAVTLGQQVDTLIRKTQMLSLNDGVIMDFCASSMTEEFCNQVDDGLKEEWKAKGLFFTDRFSPGYGDLPLDIQGTFCNVLDASRRMGLNVSSSGLMVPRKSITAIIGIAPTMQKMKIKGCKYCDFRKDCEYRKGGKVCD